MMNIQQRRDLMVRLGQYLTGTEESWKATKKKASAENHWFIPEFIELSVSNIARNFLQPHQLDLLIERYGLQKEITHPKTVGIVMAGNIPLVGFHDVLCVFLSGHYAMIKPSSRDEALIRHLVEKLNEWDPETSQYIRTSALIRNCDAYIATGSNNSARYFEFYFKKYPSIIRRNRTSVAVLNGSEQEADLEKLSDDVYQYFGLGCRNVTKIFVPQGYDFLPLLNAFKKWDYLINHHKYKNNFDYNLAIHILNNRFYMTNGSILLVEDPSPFSPISQLHYEFYTDENEVQSRMKNSHDIQCLVGPNGTHFGEAQTPDICDYADGVDTMAFLRGLA
jgi:hypothetical protein